MTKLKAIKALNNGKIVRHSSFLKDEWVKKLNDEFYIFEDGNICSIKNFWGWRILSKFKTNWEVVESNQKICEITNTPLS